VLVAEGPAARFSAAATKANLVRVDQWIEWTRTKLQPRERRDQLTALGPEQRAQLLEHDYVWVEGVGVLWRPPDGALRRARFTHGTHLRTRRAEFYVDSEGNARELSNHGFDHPGSAARSPGIVWDRGRYDFGAGDSLDNELPGKHSGT